MPQNKFALGRYQLIDALLRKNGYVKSRTIAEVCRKRIGYSISVRTVQLDIEAMRHDPLLGYFAPIEYCQRRKAFYYSEPDYTLSPIRFTEKEVLLMEDILALCSAHNLTKYYEDLRPLIQKMRIYIH